MSKTQWQHLIKRYQHNNLPHALLLAGGQSTASQNFALAFSKLLFCSEGMRSQIACGNCRGCALLQSGTHPDFYHLQPEATGKAIKIDQVRELITQLNQTAQQGRYKVAIIDPAEAMQTAAINALLKTLEEPNSATLIMLLSQQPAFLPATIRSRCQAITFQNETTHHTPLTETQQRLLDDMLALSADKNDPVQVAAAWSKEVIAEVVHTLILLAMDIIRLKSNLTTVEIIPQNKIDFLISLMRSVQLSTLFAYLDKLYQLRKPLTSINNLNPQLLLEDIFCTWHAYTNSRSHTDS